MCRHVLRFRRWALHPAAAILLFGCHTWHPAEPSPAEYITARHPSSIHLVLTDSSSMMLRNTFVRDSSVVGYTVAGLALADSARELSVPVERIASASVRKFSWGKALLLNALISIPFLFYGVGNGLLGE